MIADQCQWTPWHDRAAEISTTPEPVGRRVAGLCAGFWHAAFITGGMCSEAVRSQFAQSGESVAVAQVDVSQCARFSRRLGFGF